VEIVDMQACTCARTSLAQEASVEEDSLDGVVIEQKRQHDIAAHRFRRIDHVAGPKLHERFGRLRRAVPDGGEMRQERCRMIALRAGVVIAVVLAAVACSTAAPERDRSGFVDAAQAVPGLVVDMRYFGSENFLGRPVAGYEAPICLVTRQTAVALKRVQEQLSQAQLGLKVFDCYRPRRAVADFVAWAKDLSDQKRKAQHYPDVDKSTLFEQGYIAERSGHSRGSTVDITLIDKTTGAEIDMGSPYDLFDPKSWPSDTTFSPAAQANRMRLRSVMTGMGFRPLEEEWWHFTLEAEPYPETYFDFPVSRG
jgi:D-alanyl-D-alanine dipeptidase